MIRNILTPSMPVFAALTLLGAVCAQPAHAQTALFLDSQPGDYIGQGIRHNYAPPSATFTVTRNWKNGVNVSITTAASSDWWILDFSVAGDVPLAVGTYTAAHRFPFASGNGLNVDGQHRGCNTLSGRFVVREIVYAPDQSIVRFAADFEQVCEFGDGGLFGAVRYNSTVSTLSPFDGAYPIYPLTIAPDPHGRVTSPSGLDCGSSASACVVTFQSTTVVTLTAVGDSGYLFVRWTGDCEGEATTTIKVNTQKDCGAVFEPGIEGTTALVLDSQPGDVIGQGADRTYTPLDGTFTISRNAHGGVTVTFRLANVASFPFWHLEFSAGQGVPLTAGTYLAARAYPFTGLNSMYVSGGGRSCLALTGRFIVHEVVFKSDGSVHRFAADFEQHCDDQAPALFGAIRYKSTYPQLQPFGGQYPSLSLDVTSAGGGRVTGSGIDCRAGGPVCHLSFPTATQVALIATPDAGNVFAGWAGDCLGMSSTSVHVNGPKVCSALFEPVTPSTPRTIFYWESQKGDSVGLGSKAILNSQNSLWTVTSGLNGNKIKIEISGAINYARLDFKAVDGQPLTPGYYSAARRAAFTEFNGLDVSLSGSGCNELTGRFVILDIAIAPDGTVQRFAADFEQHCNDLVPGVFGAIRYNSAAGGLLPFDGTYPSYQLSVTPPIGGRVMGIGLACGGGPAQCTLTLPAAAQVPLTATSDAGYMFVGWTEDCSGGTMTSLNLNGAKRCGAQFSPVQTVPRTILRWTSEVGHPIGKGRSETYSEVNSRLSVFGNQQDGSVEFQVSSVGPKDSSRWTLSMRAPIGEMLQIGRRYTDAGGSLQPGMPRIGILGNGTGCDGGEFTVHELSFASPSTVASFTATFVLTCGGIKRLTGVLQYNSGLALPSTTLTVAPQSLRFAAIHNGASITVPPAPQVLRLTMNGVNAPWVANATVPWITVSPTSGAGAAAVTVALNLASVPPSLGGATGAVNFALTDGSGDAYSLGVTVKLIHAASTAPPFGYVDSPSDFISGVTGALPVTGWALDDVGVTDVTICRKPVTGEVAPADANCGGAAQIYVGQAVVIEGSRPDVEAGYPAYPRNNLAGWGFLLLTNMLPNQGNGRFELLAYARDREGRSTLLGTRTINCDNAHAVGPFGTIDTPGQGEIVGGSSYVNFGWALTPNPKQIPTDGSTLMVYVDGIPLGSPSYNHFRSDIAALFPGLANSNGAVGFKLIDLTTLSDGLHTIRWTATDSAGVTSGLGSRYFRVANGASTGATAAAAAATDAGFDVNVDEVPLDTSLMPGRRGWAPDAPWQNYATGATGRAVVRGEELDRIELALGVREGESISGYLRVGTHLSPLPAGSRLDPGTGTFTWSPGVGFIGTYDLVFVRRAGGHAIARREVRIILKTKGDGHVGTQVVIETPRSQQDLAQPFGLRGWAADLDAAAGTGVDTLHVWAYPLTGGAPVFLGQATYGLARPDLAAVQGEQFRDSGFSIDVNGLIPGNYDLAVFAWSAVSGGFAPPQVVRVTAR